MRICSRLFRNLTLLLAATLLPALARADEPATTDENHGAADSGKTEEPDDEPQVPEDHAPKGLVRLDPVEPVWIDKKRNRVVMVGKVCLRQGPLEMFACPTGSHKEHESILTVPVRPYTVHVGLLAVGAEPGNPAHWVPKFEPARGTTIVVTVFWTDEQGKRQRARAQDWIRQYNTEKVMDQTWVFGGSQLVKDEQTGKPSYLADYGEFICVSNFPGAMLDVPAESSDKAGDLLFDAFTEHIPPLGTKVTLVLTPKVGKGEKAKGDKIPPTTDDGQPTTDN